MTAAPARRSRPSPATLFADLSGVWHLWYRPGAGRWTLIGTRATYSEAFGLSFTSGHRGGDWLITDRPGRPLAKGGYSEPDGAEVSNTPTVS